MTTCGAVTCDQCTIQANYITKDFKKKGLMSAKTYLDVTKEHEVMTLAMMNISISA